jgi:hypothetical protein
VWGGQGQAREMEELRPSVSPTTVHSVCVCACVCLCAWGTMRWGAGGCEARGRGSSDPLASPFTVGLGAWMIGPWQADSNEKHSPCSPKGPQSGPYPSWLREKIPKASCPSFQGLLLKLPMPSG